VKHLHHLLLLAVLLTPGCDDGGDGSSCGCRENQDLTVYEDEVSALLMRTFSGSVEDGGSEIPCQFDGQEFEFYLELASPLSCEDTEGQPADCTNAATGIWDVEGELELDITYNLIGFVSLFGDGSQVSAGLTTDIPCHKDQFGTEFEALSFADVIGTVHWNIQHEEDSEEWEVCVLTVESSE